MQRFTVALFALLAVFAHLVPATSARAIELVKRETNAGQFERGLPPLPPTRRQTANPGSASDVTDVSLAWVQQSQTRRIQVRDAYSGYAYGYLENAPDGPHGVNPGSNPGHVYDMWVTYDYNKKRLHCKNPVFHGGEYLGGVVPDYNLGHGYPTYVPLTNVYIDDYKYEAGIWNLDRDKGELTGWWENKDHQRVPVSYAYDPDTNVIVIVADIDSYLYEHDGWYHVRLYLTY